MPLDWLESGIQFDGLFASNDLIAIGAFKALKQFRLSTPEDAAVVGFSNWNLFEMIDPPISSINQPGREMEKTACRILIKQINDKSDTQPLEQVVLDSKLVVRVSSLRKYIEVKIHYVSIVENLLVFHFSDFDFPTINDELHYLEFACYLYN